MPQGIMRAGSPRAMSAALLAGLLSLPLPTEARQQDTGRASTLTQQSIIRDKDGFRVGRMDRKPDGDIILRDKNGFRTGRIDPPRVARACESLSSVLLLDPIHGGGHAEHAHEA